MQSPGSQQAGLLSAPCKDWVRSIYNEPHHLSANAIRKLSPVRGCRAMYDRFGDTLSIGRDKSIDLLMAMGYRVRYPKRYGHATQSGTREFANLLVDKRIQGINQVWQADMAHYLYGDT